MAKSVDNSTGEVLKCPYLVSMSKDYSRNTLIQEEWSQEYDENHIVQNVKCGEVDLVKEVQSHKDEVGLLNVIKLAIAHGENPYTKFSKTEDGVMFAVDPDSTLDDIQNADKETAAAIDKLAASLGVSTDDLIKAFQSGAIDKLVEESEKKKDEGDK